MATFVPSPHDLEALLLRQQGDLRDDPYRVLLLAIATRGNSGVLTLRRGPLEKEVLFDHGAAIDCQSNIATEALGRFLVSSGRISETQHHDAVPLAAARGVNLEEILLEQTVIAPAELARASQQNLGRKLLEPFHWTQGTWQFSAEVPAMDPVVRVRVPQLIITGIGKVEPFETIENALSNNGAMSLFAGSAPLIDPAELRLSDEQQRTLAAIREGTSLGQLQGMVVSAEDLERFVFALLLLGVASTERPIPSAPMFELDLPAEKPAPAPVVAPPPPTSRSTTPMSPIASADDLTAAASRTNDPFAILGLEIDANAMEITRTFLRNAERFLPSRYPEATRDRAQEVFLACARAYAELADPVRRQALIDRRAPEAEIRPLAPAPPTPAKAPAPAKAAAPAPTKAAAAKPRRTIIDPEELYRQGRTTAAAGKQREALGYFEMAADCDAQNGTYAAEVAYCRFQLLISPAPVAIKSLKNAIRIDPRCGVAYLYLGKIQEALGNHIEAQAYLGRASTLMGR